MPQLAFAGQQTIADLAQRFRISQLAEQHGDHLAPTGKTTGVPLGLMRFHRSLENRLREQLENLVKNAAYSIHVGSLLVFGIGLDRPNPSYQSFRLQSLTHSRVPQKT